MVVVCCGCGCGCWVCPTPDTKWIVSFLQLELETPDGFAFAGQNKVCPRIDSNLSSNVATIVFDMASLNAAKLLLRDASRTSLRRRQAFSPSRPSALRKDKHRLPLFPGSLSSPLPMFQFRSLSSAQHEDASANQSPDVNLSETIAERASGEEEQSMPKRISEVRIKRLYPTYNMSKKCN